MVVAKRIHYSTPLKISVRAWSQFDINSRQAIAAINRWCACQIYRASLVKATEELGIGPAPGTSKPAGAIQSHEDFEDDMKAQRNEQLKFWFNRSRNWRQRRAGPRGW